MSWVAFTQHTFGIDDSNRTLQIDGFAHDCDNTIVSVLKLPQSCVKPSKCECWNYRPSSWRRHQWEHFPRYWPFVRGIHRSPVNSPNKGLWRGALMFSLTCVWINRWINNREAGDLRRHRVHHDVIVMLFRSICDNQARGTVCVSMCGCNEENHQPAWRHDCG